MKAEAVRIAEGLYWVGIIDWDLRVYHGYTLKGTTYNAYIVVGDDKIALIDNTYPGTSAQLWARLMDAFKKEKKHSKIDLVIQNHIEKDHSGALGEIHRKFPDAPIYCTNAAIKGLKNYYPSLNKALFKPVDTADTVDIGGRTLQFIQASMLHWPDSMFTLLLEDGILFSNDAFGQHLCFTKRFDNEVPSYVLMDSAQKFYANLLTPFSKLILRKFEELGHLGLLDKIKMIAPSHGQIWTDPARILKAYTNWASGKCKNKATIVYDTMHYSTQKMAHAFAEGLMSRDVEVAMYFLREDERSEIVKDILDSKAVLFGIPTMHNEPFPTIGDLVYYLKGLKFDRTGRKRVALAFGSFGWSGGAVKKLADDIKECGFEMFDEYELIFVPADDELTKCFEIGKEIAQKVKNMWSQHTILRHSCPSRRFNKLKEISRAGC